MLRKGICLLFLFTVLGAGVLAAAGPGTDYTPAQLAKMSPAERHAAVQAMKDRQPAPARFTGTLQRVDTNRASRAGAGTVVYDDGVFSTVGTIAAASADVMFGNRFNSANAGPIPPPITVTALAMWPALVNGSTTLAGNAWQSIFGPLSGGGGAATQGALFSSQATYTPQTWNTLPVAPAVIIPTTAAASFQAGMWNGGGAPPAGLCATDCVGFSTGSVGGQGFHGMHMQDVNGMSFMAVPGLNAMVRPSGNVVPVELMSFSVE